MGLGAKIGTRQLRRLYGVVCGDEGRREMGNVEEMSNVSATLYQRRPSHEA